jgi:hypothetical protein
MPLILGFWIGKIMARPEKTDAEKLSKTIAFRITAMDYLAYQKKFLASGLSQSEFFRKHVLTNSTQVVARSKNADRAIFLLLKASNNLNQLAHRANTDHLTGKLSESTYTSILSQLSQLNNHMSHQADEVLK